MPGYVIPSHHEYATVPQAVVALLKCTFARFASVKTPAEDTIAKDEIEVLVREMAIEMLESVGNMSRSAEFPARGFNFDRPVVAAGKETVIMLGEPIRANE